MMLVVVRADRVRQQDIEQWSEAFGRNLTKEGYKGLYVRIAAAYLRSGRWEEYVDMPRTTSNILCFAADRDEALPASLIADAWEIFHSAGKTHFLPRLAFMGYLRAAFAKYLASPMTYKYHETVRCDIEGLVEVSVPWSMIKVENNGC